MQIKGSVGGAMLLTHKKLKISLKQGDSEEREKWDYLDLKHRPYSSVNAPNPESRGWQNQP